MAKLPRAAGRRRPTSRSPRRTSPSTSTATPPRASASRSRQIDQTLYDAFGQRQVATIYTSSTQYKVVLEVAAVVPDRPDGAVAHLRAAARTARRCRSARWRTSPTRSRRSPSTTRASSPPSPSRSTWRRAWRSARRSTQIQQHGGRPARRRSRSTAPSRARRRPSSPRCRSTPLLVAAAILAVYIVLGMLYESYVHPITILSALPSAGVGALLALMIFHYDLSVIALIGIILLIGIVKKNAIMMIDFALEAERDARQEPARGDPRGLPAALPADHDDDLRGDRSAACRWRSARAPAPSCAGRSASPSSAACWCRSG